ncbi:hypothetical protein BO70DRAFT_376871 [Aspergillus heteromorphus CBS 117.55]|uniref:Structure-specific endonuclease subunit SLX4 n=1 Tax=Aspergillus heteromorphus CBS 117.55 TaxID=1448321 RepID=A0A317X294_9EURO|nr:uncharacterized protein BO70DRAFT_376871 [Aspergillus heteromorphus CBS 117.55]PWY91118.1 hypothetical protein BO70DRAFT_376871 [Aspergillus heteromorphus CBS 117.55]
MPAATTAEVEVLVLSSSPVHNTPAAAPPLAYDPEELFGLSPIDASTTPLPSPSELFRAPTRSRFFQSDNSVRKKGSAGSKTKGKGSDMTTATTTATATGIVEVPAGDQTKRTRGRPKKDPKTAPGDPEPNAEVAEKAPKKTTAGTRRKKSAETTTKGKSSGNKTISGRVGKAGTSRPKEAGGGGGGGGGGEKADCLLLTPRASPATATATKDDVPDWETDGLQLEQATKRRLDWTPTSNSTKSVVELDGKSNVEGSLKNFGDLLSVYGFSGMAAPIGNQVASGECGPTKRRRIELVDPGVYPPKKGVVEDTDKSTTDGSRQSTPTVQKKPRKGAKRFTTLTARVTANYINESAESSEAIDGGTTASEDTSAAKGKRSKSKKKGKSSSKASEPQFVVLSPDEAAKSLEDQELVFGTCSQLEREDSPTMIRELQAAIRESERSIVSESSSRSYLKSDKGASSAVSRFSGSGDLWSVASRDTDGSLMQVEVVDLVDTPVKSAAPAFLEQSSNKGEDVPTEIDINMSKHDGKETSEPEVAVPTRKEPSTITKPTQPVNTPAKDPAPQDAVSHPPMPQFSGFTDAQLSKQIATYGFKPLRSRQKMIDLLQRCWESKSSTSGTVARPTPENAQSHNPPAGPVSEPASSQPKPSSKSASKGTTRKTNPKPKSKLPAKSSKKPAAGNIPSTTTIDTSKETTSLPPQPKPQKPTTAQTPTKKAKPRTSFADVEEIEDSEDDAILTPRHLLQPFSSTTTTTTTTTKSTLPTSPTPSNSNPSLAPPTPNLPNRPTPPLSPSPTYLTK